MTDSEFFALVVERLGLPADASRRGFLKGTLGAAAGVATAGMWPGDLATAPYVIVENADGLLVSDPTRCVGCRRCELACTEFNEGRSQPALSRIKVARNYNFGPRGQQAGVGRDMGEFGNFRLIVDTCKQCPHPVPCATACPSGAIVADVKTKARVVDRERCTGCKICLAACPWEMMAFDHEAAKATKCHLCGGAPECVAACPALALRYVSWRDLSGTVPVRRAVLLPQAESAGCTSCHEVRR